MVAEAGDPGRVVTELVVSRTRQGGAEVVRVAGEVDLASCPRLTACLDEALDGEPSELVVDLSEVTFFGSLGIAALVSANNRIPGPRLPVVATPSIQRLLRIVGLDEVLDLHDDLGTAIGQDRGDRVG